MLKRLHLKGSVLTGKLVGKKCASTRVAINDGGIWGAALRKINPSSPAKICSRESGNRIEEEHCKRNPRYSARSTLEFQEKLLVILKKTMSVLFCNKRQLCKEN